MTATIKQIADELGISASTVSRALTGFAYVSENTRKKVLEKAEELDYSPNMWAQNLVGSQSNIIGCLVLELSNPFYIPMVRAIEDVTGKNELITFITETRRDLQTEKYMIERFKRVRASGVILTPVLSDLSHLKDLEKMGIPIVVVGRTVNELDSINIDNIESGKLAATHLIEKGFRRFGFIQSGDLYNHPEQERLQGFRNELLSHGLKLNTIYTVGNNHINGGEKAGELWINDKNRPEAIFCSNDMLAMGFIQSMVRIGIDIPGDVAVLGHDDTPFTDNFIVPISTIAFPKYEMGKMAIRLLLKRINLESNQHTPALFSLEPSLVERRSTDKRI